MPLPFGIAALLTAAAGFGMGTAGRKIRNTRMKESDDAIRQQLGFKTPKDLADTGTDNPFLGVMMQMAQAQGGGSGPGPGTQPTPSGGALINTPGTRSGPPAISQLGPAFGVPQTDITNARDLRAQEAAAIAGATLPNGTRLPPGQTATQSARLSTGETLSRTFKGPPVPGRFDLAQEQRSRAAEARAQSAEGRAVETQGFSREDQAFQRAAAAREQFNFQQARDAEAALREVRASVITTDPITGGIAFTGKRPAEALNDLAQRGIILEQDQRALLMNSLYRAKLEQDAPLHGRQVALQNAIQFVNFEGVPEADKRLAFPDAETDPTAVLKFEAFVRKRDARIAELRAQGLSDAQINNDPVLNEIQDQIETGKEGTISFTDSAGNPVIAQGTDVSNTKDFIRASDLKARAFEANRVIPKLRELSNIITNKNVGLAGSMQAFLSGLRAQTGGVLSVLIQENEEFKNSPDPKERAVATQQLDESLGEMKFLTNHVAFALARANNGTGRISDVDFLAALDQIAVSGILASPSIARAALRKGISTSQRDLKLFNKEIRKIERGLPKRVIPGLTLPDSRTRRQTTPSNNPLSTLGISEKDL